MAKHRPFVPFPDPRLKARAEEIGAVTEETRAIWDEMLRAMYAMPGVGLAAPQLGIGLRLAVVDCSDTRDQAVRLANPVLIESSDEVQTLPEGSPNLPDVFADITRPVRVRVRFLGQDGTVEERAFEGLWATSVQHQIDHLDGKMFFDRLSGLKRRRLLEAHRKQGRKARREGA